MGLPTLTRDDLEACVWLIERAIRGPISPQTVREWCEDQGRNHCATVRAINKTARRAGCLPLLEEPAPAVSAPSPVATEVAGDFTWSMRASRVPYRVFSSKAEHRWLRTLNPAFWECPVCSQLIESMDTPTVTGCPLVPSLLPREQSVRGVRVASEGQLRALGLRPRSPDAYIAARRLDIRVFQPLFRVDEAVSLQSGEAL